MKNLVLLISLALGINSFGQAPEGFKYQAADRDAGILIKGHAPLNGFDVKIYYCPKEIANGFHESEELYNGYCVFIFSKDGKFFPFQFESMNLPLYSAKGIDFNDDSSEVLNCPFQEITVENDILPFSFKDINFDGVDELLIWNEGGGQRGTSAYIPYEIRNNTIVDVSYWVKDEMFDSEYTEFDSTKKQIQFSHSDGFDSSYNYLYQAIFSEGIFSHFEFLKKTKYY